MRESESTKKVDMKSERMLPSKKKSLKITSFWFENGEQKWAWMLIGCVFNIQFATLLLFYLPKFSLNKSLYPFVYYYYVRFGGKRIAKALISPIKIINETTNDHSLIHKQTNKQSKINSALLSFFVVAAVTFATVLFILCPCVLFF